MIITQHNINCVVFFVFK